MDIGVDIVEIDRFRRAAKGHGKRFLNRLFTRSEIDYCRCKADPFPHLAARFAAKEAVFKALGQKKRSGLIWKDIEVHSQVSGKPGIRLLGKTAVGLKKRKIKKILLSLSHSKKYAVAQVIVI